MADKIIFEDSYGDIPLSETHFVKKEMIYITDNNTSGVYTVNQIVYDNLSLATNGRWLNFSEGFLVIPLVVTMTGVKADNSVVDFTGVNGANADMAVILKNHFGTLISSIQVDYGNTSLIQTQQNLASYIIFKQHMDVDDSYVERNTNGYRPDSHTSWSYNASNANASLMGEGMCNNNIGYQSNCSMACKIGGDLFNEGATRRSRDTMSMLPAAAAVSTGSRGRELVFAGTNNDYIKSKTSYIQDSDKCKTWFYNCTLSLKCIHDFFDKIPLVKGAQMKITLNINQCSFKIVKSDAGILTLSNESSSFPNGVNPLMFTSTAIVQGDIPLTVGATTGAISAVASTLNYKATQGGSASLLAGKYLITASVCKNMWSEQLALITGGINQSSKLTQTRLYVPAYSLKAEYEDMYMKKMKKTVTYVDTFMKEFQEIEKGMDQQLQITSSVTNPLRLIIVPMLSKSAMASASNAGVREQCSPFSSSPATTCPCLLSNFQVLVSGIQIYNQPAMYSYEQYLNEVHPSGLGYSLDMYSGSGMISLDKWINNYGYFVVNLERRLPELKTQACSLDVTFRIDSLLKLDFVVFVEVEKSMTIDLLTGGRDA